MAHVTRLSKNNVPRWHLLLIFTILLIFTKCNETSSKLHSTKLSDTFLLKESVVIPSNNAEEEAKRLYNEALKQYGDLGKTLKEICDPWKAKGCTCTGTSEEVSLICRHTRFTTVPEDLPEELIKLDLGSNNITVLKNHSFTMLPMLEELILSDNKLHTIESNAFLGMKNLKRLVLQGCGFTSLPVEAFENIKSLTSLNLANNRLTRLDDEDFPVIANLQYLFLKRNQIREISSGVFRNLSKLKVLDLDDNKLESLSSGLKNLTQLQELMLSNNKIMTISHGSLPSSLVTLELRANPLKNIHESAIRNLKKLKKLVLSDARNLNELPSFEGCISLEILRVDHSDLTHIPDSLCTHSPRLKSLELKFNKLRHVPNLRQCHELRLLNLASNRISSIHNKPFENLGQLHDLLLPYNQIETIPHDAFSGMKKLQTLSLEGNNINFIHEQAFSGFTQLEDLNLGNNIFSSLPTSGLERLLHLKTFNNPRLRIFPPIKAFPRIRTLILSYAYHCCAFLPLLTSNSKVIESPYKEEVFFPTDEKFDMSMWNNSINDIWPDLNGNVTNAFQSQMNDILQSYSNPYADFGYPSITNFPDDNELYSGEDTRIHNVYESSSTLVKCLPTPGPFLPCEDLFDWWTLRCGVWVVFLLALLGNGIVVFVLIFSRSKMDVPRFLVCNLAAADFFMGVYLGFLAVVDASTLGEFRMFAIRWQMSVGCQLSGFLAVLSSELSVYTLAVITLERNYAITHAMHLNKRLSLRHASYIMSIGWLFALTMAVLPLFGVSDYRKYSVCLPMEVYKGYGSLTYVIFLMFINGVAFLTLMGCYLKMYCAIRGSQAWNSNDSRIAKRMALLVFTDFLCWSPIAFFSIAAVLGWQLITLEQAKVFTVFILPLNSCCNPFLYAILTKQFKKDCVMLCKAIEESRVTRGIGRCRHSSNFSNRQTPGNTNSLNERSSRDGAIPPLLPAHACNCNRGKVIDHEEIKRQLKKAQPSLFARFWKRLFCSDSKNLNVRRNHRHMDYSYHIAEVQQKNHKRAGSMSSSDGNFSSSRSDSWKHGTPHHCGVPLRLLDPRRRHTSWLITRKTSQDSNLSSSRNDSSGSNNTTATTASGSTWRISRSSGSNIVIPGLSIPTFSTCNSSRQSISGNKPRLVRQSAFHDETQEPTSPRLNVRFLPTIPSAPDSSVQMDDENQDDPENQEDCVHLQIINNIENDTENSTNSSSPNIKSKPP